MKGMRRGRRLSSTFRDLQQVRVSHPLLEFASPAECRPSSQSPSHVENTASSPRLFTLPCSTSWTSIPEMYVELEFHLRPNDKQS
ncbi:unnamed protein product [Linum trigynum]|uniref:Uncharacterized protein n=1 Tax=Linum trigynum TaxID=586398 RepID=A0AAV2EV96_9ROSI